MKKTLFLLPLLLLSSCSKQIYLEHIEYFFDTTIKTSLTKKDDINYQDILDIISTYHRYFDIYNHYNGITNIYDINQDNDIHLVDQKLFSAFKTAKEYMNVTNGYFNPFIGSLKKAYENAYNTKTPLTNEEIIFYVNEMNKSSLILNEEDLSIQRVGTSQLDFGAFAKGYTLKIIKELLNDRNIEQYLINAGFSSILLGHDQNKDIKVHLKYDPKHYLLLKNTSIGVSSDYERGFEINNERYSHIINPFTGLASVKYDFTLVVDEDPLKADVYSTVFSLMDLDEIQSTNIKCLIYQNQQKIYSSNDLEDYYY